MRDPKLRSLYNQMANAYKATINAIENDDHKQAVTLQLSAIDSLNKFNEAVQKYNVVIRSFPKNILAGIFGFDKMNKFEAEAGAESAPKVKF